LIRIYRGKLKSSNKSSIAGPFNGT
jgi:hypothetical protein